MSETNQDVGEVLCYSLPMKDTGEEFPSDAPRASYIEGLLEVKDKKIETLQEELKAQKKLLNNEEFLFNNSTTFKRLQFSVWLQTKYYQLLDTDAKDPRIDDVDRLTLELQKYIPTSLESDQMRCHHNENNYIYKLNQLNSQMSAWAKGICNGHEDFTVDDVKAILTSLNKLSMTGGKTVEGFEEHDLISKFNTRRHHKILYHHLIALAIYERVLSSFAFGMDTMASKQLHAIQNALLTQGMYAYYLILTE